METTMKILITGGSGLVGSAIREKLAAEGHDFFSLVRREPRSEREIRWNPEGGTIDSAALEGFDAVIHLAGEGIAGRWTAAKKQRIRDSRLKGTRLLCKSLAKLARPPRVLLSASAVGFYGNRGNEILTETSAPGNTFLSKLCTEWEAAADHADQNETRVVKLRLGVVLSRNGGALKKMLLPFKLGAGGIIGDGKQYWSWIAIDDVVGAVRHALTTETLRGAVNIVAPNPVTNREFTRSLGKVLHRPTIFPMPAFAARLAFGEMADELFLGSARVQPEKLLATGYTFRFPQLEGAFRHLLSG
jgi:uncharacterized protein (TIGR01777 family)